MILVEPQCHKAEHSMVNALFINGLLKHSLGVNFIFFAEENHIELVSDNLHSINQITFKSINIPKRGYSNARRLIKELKLVIKIFFYAKKIKCYKIVFLSCTSAGIFSIKFLSIFFKKINIFIVLHSVIETIDKKIKKPIWDYPFNLIYILSIFNKKNIKFILFNKYSFLRFEKDYKNLSSSFFSIEFPFEYIIKPTINSKLTNNEDKIIFASIGDFNVRKNSLLFFDLANQNSQNNSNFAFWFIGRIDIFNIDVKNVHIVSSDHILDDKNYNNYIEMIDYAVFLFNYEFYRYTVSGTLYDAIFHLKPILAIRTPFFEDFFLKYGNIGYLCDTYNDMLILLNTFKLKKNSEVYLEQQINLKKARRELNDNFFNSLHVLNNSNPINKFEII
jgi:hypothetical protein